MSFLFDTLNFIDWWRIDLIGDKKKEKEAKLLLIKKMQYEGLIWHFQQYVFVKTKKKKKQINKCMATL